MTRDLILQPKYHFHQTEIGTLYIAASCQFSGKDGFLVISPDNRAAQFTTTTLEDHSCPETLKLLLFWKGLLGFGQNLPLVQACQMMCAVCGKWVPILTLGLDHHCWSCRRPETYSACSECKKQVKTTNMLQTKCLPCWTVTGIMLHFGIHPVQPKGLFDPKPPLEPEPKPTPSRPPQRIKLVRAQD